MRKRRKTGPYPALFLPRLSLIIRYSLLVIQEFLMQIGFLLTFGGDCGNHKLWNTRESAAYMSHPGFCGTGINDLGAQNPYRMGCPIMSQYVSHRLIFFAELYRVPRLSGESTSSRLPTRLPLPLHLLALNKIPAGGLRQRLPPRSLRSHLKIRDNSCFPRNHQK